MNAAIPRAPGYRPDGAGRDRRAKSFASRRPVWDDDRPADSCRWCEIVIDEKRRLALPGDPHRVWLHRVAPLLRYRLRGRVGAFVGWCIVPIILVCPLLIPSANIGLRAASAFASGESPSRWSITFAIGACGAEQGPSRLLPLLDPVPGILRRLSRSQAAVAASGEPLAAGPASHRWDRRLHHRPPGDRGSIQDRPVRSSFALNHAVMLPTFVLAIESLSRAYAGSNAWQDSTRLRSSGTPTCRGPSPSSGDGTTTGSMTGSTATSSGRPEADRPGPFRAAGVPGQRLIPRGGVRAGDLATDRLSVRVLHDPGSGGARLGRSSAWPVEAGSRARSRPTGPRSSSSPSRPSSSSTGSARSSPSSMPARRRCRSMQGLDSRGTAR